MRAQVVVDWDDRQDALLNEKSISGCLAMVPKTTKTQTRRSVRINESRLARPLFGRG
jgi:hypothetical protein